MSADAVAQALLFLAATLQVIAAAVALYMITLSGRRVLWSIVCAGLLVQAGRRVYSAAEHANLTEAWTALAVSVLLLAGVVGIRVLLLSLERSRRALEERTRSGAFVNRVGAAMVVLDPEGCIIELNDETAQLIAVPQEEALGLDWFETFVNEGIREDVRKSFTDLLASPDGGDEYVEYTLVGADGEERTVVWHRRVLRDQDGNVKGVRSAGIDLSVRLELQDELAFHSMLLDRTSDSVLVYEQDGTIIYANDAACHFRECPHDELIGTNIRELIPEANREEFESRLKVVRDGAYTIFETEVPRPGGGSRPLESSIAPTAVGDRDLIVDVARDISERRRSEAAMRKLAYSDPLTGLANRALLWDRAALSTARAQRCGEQLAVLFVDIDHLKEINDHHGHAIGDQVLRIAAKQLSTVFREEDTVARVGGDEFVVLARVKDAGEAEELAARVATGIECELLLNGRCVPVSASVGVAVYPDEGSDLDTLLARADSAMYGSKSVMGGPGASVANESSVAESLKAEMQ